MRMQIRKLHLELDRKVRFQRLSQLRFKLRYRRPNDRRLKLSQTRQHQRHFLILRLQQSFGLQKPPCQAFHNLVARNGLH